MEMKNTDGEEERIKLKGVFFLIYPYIVWLSGLPNWVLTTLTSGHILGHMTELIVMIVALNNYCTYL